MSSAQTLQPKASRQPEALAILADNPNITSSEFAELFWPGNHMHKRIANQGHGACIGKGAWMAGAFYLAKLQKKELVKQDHNPDSRARVRWSVTAKGKEVLAASSTP